MSDGETIWRRDGRNVEELPDPLGGRAPEPPSEAPEAPRSKRRRYWKYSLYGFSALLLITLVWLILTAPLSRALEPLGPLTISAIEMRWSICRNVRVARVVADMASTVYVLEGQPGCVLDGQPITHLKLVPKAGGAGGRCGAELSLFATEKAWRATQPDAWGLVERSPCP